MRARRNARKEQAPLDWTTDIPAFQSPAKGALHRQPTLAELIDASVSQARMPTEAFERRFDWLEGHYKKALGLCDVCDEPLPTTHLEAGVCSQACAEATGDEDVRVRFQAAEKLAVFQQRVGRELSFDEMFPASPEARPTVTSHVRYTHCRRCGQELPPLKRASLRRRPIVRAGYCSDACLAGARIDPLAQQQVQRQDALKHALPGRQCVVCRGPLFDPSHISVRRRLLQKEGFCSDTCKEIGRERGIQAVAVPAHSRPVKVDVRVSLKPLRADLAADFDRVQQAQAEVQDLLLRQPDPDSVWSEPRDRQEYARELSQARRKLEQSLRDYMQTMQRFEKAQPNRRGGWTGWHTAAVVAAGVVLWTVCTSR